MKKFALLLLSLMLVFCFGNAMAAKEVYPGDTITMYISITESNGEGSARININAGSAPVTFVSASSNSSNGNMVVAPPNLSGRFSIINTNGIETGSVGTVTLRVNSNAAPGTYSVYAVGSMAATGVSGSVTFTVVKRPCETHKWKDVTDVEATCTTDGSGHKVCSECSTKGENFIIKSNGHVPGTPVVEKEATCTTDGKKVTYCKTCDAVMEETPIKANGHVKGEAVVITPATCTTPGKRVYLCSVCKKQTSDQAEEIPALNHDLVDDKAIAATCMEDGKQAGKHCTRCDYTEGGETINKLAHNLDKVDTVGATCSKTGSKKYYCSMCNQLQKTETLEKLAHTVVPDVAVAPTCTKTGKTEGSHCSVCKTVIVKQETVAALGHKFNDGVVTTAATCTKDGVKTFTCTNYGCKQTKTETVKKLGHDYDEGKVTIAPTCTKDGVKTYTCKNDAKHTKTETIKATGHAWDNGTVTTPATCTTAGVKTYTCKNDATHTKTETIKATGHAWDNGTVTTPATCTEDGEKSFTCKNDPSHTKTETVKKLGHKFTAWKITREPTEELDGERERTCQNCGLVETQTVPYAVYYQMTVCSSGIRFRDIHAASTDKWYMFTPIDISVDGEQVFDLIAGNIHVIGEVHVVVKEGTVTVTYELCSERDINVREEFLTILPSIEGVTDADIEKMTQYEFGAPISIEEDLGGDTKVILYMVNTMIYEEDTPGIRLFYDNEEYDAYVEQLKTLMD